MSETLKQLNIYKVALPLGRRLDWDNFDSFVCIASNEEEARKTYPSEESDIWFSEGPTSSNPTLTRGWYRSWFGDPCKAYVTESWIDEIETLNVTLIGTAVSGSVTGVIVASFNAG